MRSIKHSTIEFQLTQEDEHLLKEAIDLLGEYRTDISAGKCSETAAKLEAALSVLITIRDARQITE